MYKHVPINNGMSPKKCELVIMNIIEFTYTNSMMTLPGDQILRESSTYRLKCYFVSSGCISLVSSSFKSVLYSPIHHTYYIYFALEWVRIATCKVPWQSHTYVEWLWRLGMLQMESPNHLVLYLVLLIVIYHPPDLRSFIMHQFRKLLSFTNLEAKYVTREEVKPIPWGWKDGSVILRMPACLF